MARVQGILRVVAIAGALAAVAGCDKTNNPADDGGGNPVIDLSHGPPDLTTGGGPTSPTCTPPGIASCGAGQTLYASPTASGCFANGTIPPNPIVPPYDNPNGTCASVGDVVIACSGSPSCSFCMKPTAAVPPGCAVQ